VKIIEINQVHEIKIKNILEILSTIRIKLIDGTDILVFKSILKDNEIQTNEEIIDNTKKRRRFVFFIGKKTKVIIGKRITKIKFIIRL